MIVAPSLLSADFGHLARQIETVEAAGATWLHCDVMDGVFVPNISFGFPVIETVGKLSGLPLDVHLMIVEPEKYISRVRDCGAAIMNVHVEACRHLHRTVQEIHNAGMKAAVTLNPATPVELLTDIAADLDMVLVMSVNPGFGGQGFIRHSIEKISRLKKLLNDCGSKALIEVDGGINAATGAECAQAGADALVAGSYVFGSPNPAEAIESLRIL